MVTWKMHHLLTKEGKRDSLGTEFISLPFALHPAFDCKWLKWVLCFRRHRAKSPHPHQTKLTLSFPQGLSFWGIIPPQNTATSLQGRHCGKQNTPEEWKLRTLQPDSYKNPSPAFVNWEKLGSHMSS